MRDGGGMGLCAMQSGLWTEDVRTPDLRCRLRLPGRVISQTPPPAGRRHIGIAVVRSAAMTLDYYRYVDHTFSWSTTR